MLFILSRTLYGFQVEMFADGENVGWATLVRRLHSTHYTQNFLKPGQSYLFLVRAENSHGLSPPSHLSKRITLPTEYRQNMPFSHDMSIAKSTLFGGHIVDLIDIKTVSSTSIKIFWEVSTLGDSSVVITAQLRSNNDDYKLQLMVFVHFRSLTENFWMVFTCTTVARTRRAKIPRS